MRFPGFVGDSGTTQSLLRESQRLVNMYVERTGEQGALYTTPGLKVWSDTATDIGTRALQAAGDRLFGVLGAQPYEFSATGVATKRGVLMAVDGNPAQIIYNGQVGGQLGFASGGNFYAFDLTTNVFTPVLVGEAHVIAYAGGRGFALNLNTGKVRLSNLNNFLVWDAGTFFQRQLAPDPYRTIFTDGNNLLWCVGTDSFEVRYDSGTGTQPWVPLTGLQGPYGIVGSFAWGRLAAGHLWVAQNKEGVGEIVMTQRSVPTPISTYPVATAVAQYLRAARIDDAEILAYQQENHTFGVIGFPSAQSTSWAVDVGQQSWAERGVWNPARGDYDIWAPRCVSRAWNKLIVGDRTTKNLYTMDTTNATEADGVTGIRRLRRSPHLTDERKRVPITRFELLMDVGLGIQVGQGSDPKAMLRMSYNGGRTWSNEIQASVGKAGDWGLPVVWNRLGAPANAVFEVSYSEPIPFRIVDAYLNNLE